MPFKVDLPLKVGSGPFNSKRGRIFYLLSVTMLASEDGQPVCARKSQEIALISVFDRMSPLETVYGTDSIQLKRH